MQRQVAAGASPGKAVLCDFGGREPQSVLDTIVLRLRNLID